MINNRAAHHNPRISLRNEKSEIFFNFYDDYGGGGCNASGESFLVFMRRERKNGH